MERFYFKIKKQIIIKPNRLKKQNFNHGKLYIRLFLHLRVMFHTIFACKFALFFNAIQFFARLMGVEKKYKTLNLKNEAVFLITNYIKYCSCDRKVFDVFQKAPMSFFTF